jgi:glycine hydroxymethyltransferase
MTESIIQELVEKHEKMRSEGLNLIPSENWLSPAVRGALATDLGSRYHSSWYGGTEHIRRIIEETENLARRIFRARFAMVTPLSGLTCDLTALHAFTAPGDKVAIPPLTVGGFPLGIEKFHRKRILLPMDEAAYVPDAGRTNALLASERPALAFLGASFIFFPHPVRQIAEFVRGNNLPTRVVYDGAHVLGLIATGEFQDPLREGAEVLFGSTHKSLYGPQGGLILTNSKELDGAMRSLLDVDVETGIGLVDNPHMNRVAALGVALEELQRDRGFGTQVIKNAKALARALEEVGVPMRFSGRGYTESHQLLLDIRPERAVELCHRMEKAGIFVDEGGRLGTAEVTHRGMREDDMPEVAGLFAEVYKRGAREGTRKAVAKLARKFSHRENS